MRTFKEYQPTAFDCKGLGSDGQEDWLVLPVIQTRDSGPLDLSNFQAALDRLGGESETVEVHRFGHWGPGWFEIIVTKPNTEAATEAAQIEKDLANYPLLNEDDFSEREWNEYAEGWEQYGAADFADNLVKHFDLGDRCAEVVKGADIENLRRFFEAQIPSGEYYIGESSGISIRTDVADCTATDLAKFIRENR